MMRLRFTEVQSLAHSSLLVGMRSTKLAVEHLPVTIQCAAYFLLCSWLLCLCVCPQEHYAKPALYALSFLWSFAMVLIFRDPQRPMCLVPSLWHYWEVVDTFKRWGLVGSLGRDIGTLAPPLCLLDSGLPWDEQLVLPYASCHGILPHHRLQSINWNPGEPK
jgi:hypothetical protein